jgi:hypothetical protein
VVGGGRGVGGQNLWLSRGGDSGREAQKSSLANVVRVGKSKAIGKAGGSKIETAGASPNRCWWQMGGRIPVLVETGGGGMK